MNMNKTPITYRQEKSHMMGSMERSFADQSTLQEDERMALSFMDAHTCSTRSEPHTHTHLYTNIYHVTDKNHMRIRSMHSFPAYKLDNEQYSSGDMRGTSLYGFYIPTVSYCILMYICHAFYDPRITMWKNIMPSFTQVTCTGRLVH